MEWIKRHITLLVVIIIAFALVLPIGINALYFIDTNCEILHKPSEWTTFWGSYISGIASFAMVFATWWTLKQNKAQHQDTLQHWEDEVRPYIEVRIVKYFFPHQVCLEFYNFGKTTAKDITFSFKQTFLDKIKNKDARNALSEMGNHPFYLLGGSTRLIPIAQVEDVSSIKVYMIGNQSVSEQIFKDAMLEFTNVQTIEVCGKYGNKYTFDEVIPFVNCDGERRTIEASLGNITRALDNISKRLNPIDTASLENIAQSISTLSSIIKTKKMSDTSLDNIDKTLSSLLENIKAIKASEEKIQRAISRKEKQTKTNN